MKAIIETPHGDYYAVPANEAEHVKRLLARSCRVAKLDWDQFAYDGPAGGAIFLLDDEKIEGLPARLRNLRKRRLTAWYLASLTAVSYFVAINLGLPQWLEALCDAGTIMVATLITVWLRERDWI